MKKIIAGIASVCLFFSVCTTVLAAEKTVSDSGISIAISTTTELKNWQQTDSPWGSYVVKNPKKTGPNNNIWCTGCGIVSLCNAVHYATGQFMDPRGLAEWANVTGGYHGDYTDANILYPHFYETFHDALGFTCTSSTGEILVIQYLGNQSKSVLIKRITEDGATFVGYVYNHFVSIVDYDPATDKFLVWDNAAGNFDDGSAGYTTNRNGITHFGGDWMTYEQFRGTLANINGDKSKFKVEYVIPIVPVAGKQMEYIGRNDLMFGTAKLQPSGKCCNFTPVDFTKSNGKTLDFKGSYTGKDAVTAFGYSLDNGSVTWMDDALMPAQTDAQKIGQKMVGNNSDTKNFCVKVPVEKETTKVNIYVRCGTQTRMIWTAQKALTGTTAVYSTKPEVEKIKTFVARDEVLNAKEYAIDQHGNYPEIFIYDFSKFIGKTLTFCGWFATNEGAVQSFGLSEDDGIISYHTDYRSAVSAGAQGHANSKVGIPNYTGYFSVPVKITDKQAHVFKIYAKVETKDVLLWTINASAANGGSSSTTVSKSVSKSVSTTRSALMTGSGSKKSTSSTSVVMKQTTDSEAGQSTRPSDKSQPQKAIETAEFSAKTDNGGGSTLWLILVTVFAVGVLSIILVILFKRKGHASHKQ